MNGTVTVSGSAYDNLGISAVELRVDSGPYMPTFGTKSPAMTWSLGLDTSVYGAGAHTLTARVTDLAGNKAWAGRTISFDTTTSNGIYWGSWIDGPTYDFLYGGSWGSVPWDSNTWNRFESNAGKTESIAHWGVGRAWEHDFNFWKRRVQPRAQPWRHQPDRHGHGRRAAARHRERRVRRGLQGLGAAGEGLGAAVFLRWDAEMNGRWSFWGTTSTNANTPAEFVAAWRHVHNIFTSNGATNVTWVWCPNLEYSATTPSSSSTPATPTSTGPASTATTKAPAPRASPASSRRATTTCSRSRPRSRS